MIDGQDPEEIQASLLEHAARTAAEENWQLTPEGRERAADLAAVAASKVQDEGDLARARESVRALITTATTVPSEQEGRATRGPGETGRLDDNGLDQALLSLCPGLWPFC
jgi:hypothetical protein